MAKYSNLEYLTKGQISIFCSYFSVTLSVTIWQLYRMAYFIDSVPLLMQQNSCLLESHIIWQYSLSKEVF